MIPNTPVRYNRLTERPIPPFGYRNLNQGEALTTTDALALGDQWAPVTKISEGNKVNNYPGYIRKEAR